MNKTVEEFYREKIQALNPIQQVITLHLEMIDGEQAMRWAKEFSDLQSSSKDARIKELEARLETAENMLKKYEFEDDVIAFLTNKTE